MRGEPNKIAMRNGETAEAALGLRSGAARATMSEHPVPWTTHEGEIRDANGELVARTWIEPGPWGRSSEIRVAARIVSAVNAQESGA